MTLPRNTTFGTLRKFALALAVAGGSAVPLAIPRPAWAHDGPGAQHDPAAAIRASRQMAEAAHHLWDALTPEQQKIFNDNVGMGPMGGHHRHHHDHAQDQSAAPAKK